MDEPHLLALSRYRDEVAALPNESAKTHRFMALVAELFPNSDIVGVMCHGTEKMVRLGAKQRRLDSYFNNAVIEFEKNLAVSLATAEKQLREQVAGLWNGPESPDRPLVAIASDGIRWECYQPRLQTDREVVHGYGPDDVALVHFHTIQLTSESLSAFWFWLTGLLFREGSVRPSSQRLQHDFGATSLAYNDAIRALRKVWKDVGDAGEAKVAFDTWRIYLNITYGQLADAGAEVPSDDTVLLFLKHTYLAILSRFLVWAALARGEAPRGLGNVITDCLTGKFFEDRNLSNLVEADFFQWVRLAHVIAALAPTWERMLVQVLGYDLKYLDEDVLKGIYQELVDPKDRHDLGEYYTPEWLCQCLVSEMLPTEGVCGVMDPTCGSGSFLRASLAHFLRTNADTEPGELLDRLIANVVGIDIHPLAVAIARATYVLALRDLIERAGRPIQIPVYLADSLFLPKEVHAVWNGGRGNYEVSFGLGHRKSFELPKAVLNSSTWFDSVIALGHSFALDLARTGQGTSASVKATLKRQLPDLMMRDEADEIAAELWIFVEGLAELIRTHENSIWSFIIRNSYRPALLRERFDVILGNPPWLSYRYISDPDYQAEVKKRAIDDHGVAPRKQKLLTQMELATVFLAHALKTFGKPASKETNTPAARLAFVMPRSVLTADQHEPFRSHRHKGPVKITEYWDLFDVRPLFNVPSCVIFAERTESGKQKAQSPGWTLPAIEWSGRLEGRNESWDEAEPKLTRVKKRARIIKLGERSALSTAKQMKLAPETSFYQSQFHQGATIVPRNFYFVTVDWRSIPFAPDALYTVRTDREQAQIAKPPYNEIMLSGRIDGQFLFKAAIAKHVLPFLVLEPADVFLPIEIEGGKAHVRTARELWELGFIYPGKWMGEGEEEWERLRGQKLARSRLIDWLDYSSKLTKQPLDRRYLVLYNASGTNISAAVFDRKATTRPFFVDHKLYYFATAQSREAHYLAAVLNAEVINELIKPFQSVGLQGERDIHKKVLELPIPKFDPAEQAHARLAALGAKARAQVECWRKAEPASWPSTLAKQRAMVREQARDQLAEIDGLVQELLG